MSLKEKKIHRQYTARTLPLVYPIDSCEHSLLTPFWCCTMYSGVACGFESDNVFCDFGQWKEREAGLIICSVLECNSFPHSPDWKYPRI
jgi:hypothetical protein